MKSIPNCKQSINLFIQIKLYNLRKPLLVQEMLKRCMASMVSQIAVELVNRVLSDGLVDVTTHKS